jgi:hypothetical protein
MAKINGLELIEFRNCEVKFNTGSLIKFLECNIYPEIFSLKCGAQCFDEFFEAI